MGDWKIIPDDDCVDINDNGIVTFNKECINLKDKYTVIYNNGMCESKTTIIVKKEDVCNKFIVDGGEWDNVPSTGAATCDSAFLWVDGTPQFTPESASTWITINKYYWDTDDPSMMCTNYGSYPCVANNLMYQAGLVTTQVDPCNAEHNPPLTSLPKVVQDAVNKIGEYKHALGTIRYTVAPNPTNKPRSCTIRWIVNSQECPSRDFTITQLGALVCKCNDLKVSGDKTIDSSARNNFEIGTYTAGCVTNIAASEPADWITSISASNGSIKASINENTSTTNTRATEITVTGKAGSEICTKSFTLTQNPKTETCTCNATGHKNPISSAVTTSRVDLGTYSSTCSGTWSATIKSGTDFLTDFSFSNGTISAKVSVPNTSATRTSVYTATIGNCSDDFTVVQAGAEPCTTCEDANIQGLSGGATAEGGTNILIGSFAYDCDPGLTAKRVSGGDFITNMTVSNGNVYGTVAANTETTARTEDIGIYVGTTKCAQYTFTQQGATPSTCTCQEANVQVGTTAITLGNAAYSSANTTYSHDCTVYINNNEAEGWLDVNSTNGKLEFNSISQATSERSANVYIDDIDGRHCETIKVTQEGPVHTYSFKFKYYDYEEGPMVTGDYNRYTGYDVTDFEVDGQPTTMQVEVYYRRSFFSSDNEDCIPTSFQNYTGGTSANSVQSYLEGTKWCGGSLIHVNGFMVKYNGIILKQMQGHDSELDGTYEGEFS